MKKILIVVVLLTLALVGYKILQPKNATINSTTDMATDTSTFTDADLDNIPPTYNDYDQAPASPSVNSELNSQPAPPVIATSIFSCDGRQHCSQMTSCEEARYFIKHCPNTKMDGDNDGIPCEERCS